MPPDQDSKQYCVFTLKGVLVGEFGGVAEIAYRFKADTLTITKVLQEGSVFKQKYYLFKKEKSNQTKK